MKKIHVILLSMIVLLLCGCAIDPATYYFDADDIKNQATKIQFKYSKICYSKQESIASAHQNHRHKKAEYPARALCHVHIKIKS